MKETMNNYEEMNQKYLIPVELSNEEQLLGFGGFGTVYKGLKIQTQTPVAIKQISKCYTPPALFTKEIQTLKQIEKFGGHPQIAQYYDYYEDLDYYYIILEYVKGGEMFDQLVSLGSYSESDASRMLRQVARALVFLHCIGIVHVSFKTLSFRFIRFNWGFLS